MATATRICRVCGCTYKACHTLRPAGSSFRWQEVACSPECGAKYVAGILASRGQLDPSESDCSKGTTDTVEPKENKRVAKKSTSAAKDESRAVADKIEADKPVVNDTETDKSAEVVSDTAPAKKKTKKNKA